MSGFNCSEFLDECHACCCGVLPFERDLYNANEAKIVNKPVKIEEHNEIDPFDNKAKDFIIPITKNMKCCFLKDDNQCAIYKDRPKVCQVYGDESIASLSCYWQDKEGKKRSRQGKRLLERNSKKNLESFLKRNKQKLPGEQK